MREETAVKMTSRLLLLVTLLCALSPLVEMSPSSRRHLSDDEDSVQVPNTLSRTKRQYVFGNELRVSTQKHVLLARHCRAYASNPIGHDNPEPKYLYFIYCVKLPGQEWNCAPMPCMYFYLAEQLIEGSGEYEAFLRTLPSQFVTIVPFPGRTWGYVHDIRHGLRKRRSSATGDTSHSMVSGQSVDPDSDPALRRAINHAIAEARRLKAAGDALQSIPAEFRTPALDEAAEETFGHQVKDTKVAKAMKVPVPKSAKK